MKIILPSLSLASVCVIVLTLFPVSGKATVLLMNDRTAFNNYYGSLPMSSETSVNLNSLVTSTTIKTYPAPLTIGDVTITPESATIPFYIVGDKAWTGGVNATWSYPGTSIAGNITLTSVAMTGMGFDVFNRNVGTSNLPFACTVNFSNGDSYNYTQSMTYGLNSQKVALGAFVGFANTDLSASITSVQFTSMAGISIANIVTAVPEPSSYALLFGGFSVLLLLQFRNRRLGF